MRQLRRFLPFVAMLIVIPLALVLFSGLLSDKVSAEQLSLAEDALRRAAAECYALEGFYPTEFHYLTAHYGVVVDETQYCVQYQYVASNLMPDITIIPLN